jgi:hypothetical protein
MTIAYFFILVRGGLSKLSVVATPVVFIATSFDDAIGGKIPKGNTHHDKREVLVQHGSTTFRRLKNEPLSILYI